MSPSRMTVAPWPSVCVTFTVGVLVGMTIVAGTQAVRVIGEALRMIARRGGDHTGGLRSSDSCNSVLSAPRSL